VYGRRYRESTREQSITDPYCSPRFPLSLLPPPLSLSLSLSLSLFCVSPVATRSGELSFSFYLLYLTFSPSALSFFNPCALSRPPWTTPLLVPSPSPSSPLSKSLLSILVRRFRHSCRAMPSPYSSTSATRFAGCPLEFPKFRRLRD